MFWHMAGLSTASPVETILDKDNFTLDELLDEDEIIQECKALNGRLISFLRERSQVKQLVQYIVHEVPDGASKERILKFPFVACEIFTCEVDIILKALVEDEELMDLLFSFLDPEHSHSSQLAGYFSKVVVCLLLRKSASLMNYIRDHQDIIKKLVNLIGITSIMEVLIRFIGADEHIYANCGDTMQWLEDMDILDMILDKFSSSDCAEVHANAAETLCTVTRWAPPALASKISSPNFIGRLFHHALEESRPKTVLVNLLLVCISLLDPKRLTSGIYYMYNRQTSHGPGATTNPETVKSMLENLGNLLKLLDVSSEDILLTTYGKLQPPLGKRRLKIIEFISVLVAVSSEVAEKELIRLGAMERVLELFFQYPYNNFLHHHVEHIIISCLGSKNHHFVDHLLHGCNLVGKILDSEKNFTLTVDESKPTVCAERKSPPRIGNIGHITRIANKLIQLGNSDSEIQEFLQENSDWAEWQKNVLLKRNALENVFQWTCGRPTTLQDQARDSDEDDYQDRDYDVAALANNLSQAFKYGIYSNDASNEEHSSIEHDDEDVYFDDESAEVVISSLRLGDNQESGGGSLFTNSNWFAFEDGRIDNEHSVDPKASSSPEHMEDDIVEKAEVSEPSELEPVSESYVPETISSDKAPEWVEWRESSDSVESPTAFADAFETPQSPTTPTGELLRSEANPEKVEPDSAETPQSAEVYDDCRSITEEGEEDARKSEKKD